MNKIEYNAYAKDGVFKIRNSKQFKDELNGLKDGEYEIIVQRKRRVRSIPLNKYYWYIVIQLVRDRFVELGNEVSKSETHDFLKQRFNYKELINEKTGEVIQIGQTTTKMTNTEFMLYLEKIKEFGASTLGIYIPDPNEQTAMDFATKE